MKKILTAIASILLLTQCAEKHLEYESTLKFNEQLVLNSLSLWKDALKSKDSFTTGRITQFNKDMSTFYQENVTSTTKQLNPFYYNSISIPYYYGNGNNSSDILKSLLKNKQIEITDSLSFDKELSFKSKDSKLMSTNITVTLYKTEYNNFNTWFVGKVNHNEFYSNSEEFSTPIFSYNYAIKDKRILSFLMCNINYNIDGNQNTFLIRLNEIDVINDKVEYEDFTKKYLDITTKNLNQNNISVSYK